MNARTTVAVGTLAVALTLGLAAHAHAGGIVYWGSNTRVITTETPVVTTTQTAPVIMANPYAGHVVGEAYRSGYADGYRDGAAASSTVLTTTRTVPVVTTPVVTTYRTTYTTVPRVVVHRSPVLVHRSILPGIHVGHRRHYRPHYRHFGHGYRPHCGSSGGIVVRW